MQCWKYYTNNHFQQRCSKCNEMKTLPCINTLMCDQAWHALVRSQRGPLQRKKPERIPTYRRARPNFKVSGIFENHGVIQYRTRVCLCSNSCGNCIIFCRPMSVSVCSSGSVDCTNNKSSRLWNFHMAWLVLSTVNVSVRAENWPGDYKSRNGDFKYLDGSRDVSR